MSEPTMIERVKAALKANIDAALPEGVTVDYDYAARAAIEAMREPTLGMVRAVNDQHPLENLAGCWVTGDYQTMIDAALAEEQR